MNKRGKIIMNLSPKQYPNLNKYFNKTPKGFILFFLIMYALSAVGTFLALFGALFAGEGFFGALFSFVVTAAATCFVYWLYLSQVTFARAKMGKHLKKYYGLEGDALKAQIDKIEAEVGKPLYADASKKKKYNAFFVTENWLVGTDGIMLLRANACKRADIKSVEPAIYTRTRKGITYYYHILKVVDKNDYTYEFWLRSEENVAMAYEFLTKEQ